MARTTVSVYLDNASISRLTLPGGDVNRRVNLLAREVLLVSQRKIITHGHVRTGALLGSGGTGGGSSNQYGCSERVTYSAAHAKYVLGGTRSPIFPVSHRFLKFRSAGGAGPYIYRRQVSGQRADNFLGEALTEVMRANFL